MTELSYTAWDDNKYQWPPPDGWYQASDGKWWPEGYGPVAAAESGSEGSESAHAGSAAADDGGYNGVEPDSGEDSDPFSTAADESLEAADGGYSEQVTAGIQAGYDAATENAAESAPEFTADTVADEWPDVDHLGRADDIDRVDTGEGVHGASHEVEAEFDMASDVDTNGVSESGRVSEGDGDEILDGVASSLSSGDDSSYATDSQYSTSSAGMAASGFASQTEGGSPSLGLAGWAQTGSSDVDNQVDVGHEYDYGATDAEPTDLIDPVEVPDDHSTQPGHGFEEGFEAVGAAALHTSIPDSSTPDTSYPDGSNPDTSSPEATTLDAQAEPIDSTLNRLDDLKRQVEEQSFTADAAAGATATVPDLDVEGFDPSETLDIDPSDLALETNPYYGGADEIGEQGVPSTVDAEEAPNLDADVAEGDLGGPDPGGAGNGHGDRVETDSDEYGHSPAADATIEMPPPIEDQHAYEGAAAAAAVAEQPGSMGDGFGAPQVDYSSGPVLTPMSSPPPNAGRGRVVLYGIIVLLALVVAGVAGYLLFQLQGDDGDTATGDDAAAGATTAGGDAGPSDTSGQEAGSFSNPHELLGGVRLTVPLEGENREVWMLQVREPAASSDLGDDQVEVTSRIRVRNDSPSGDLSTSGLRFVLVSADGATGTTAAANCSSGDDLDRQAAIEPGKDIEGNVCWTVPAAQATGALLGIESVHAAGRVHVQLS